MTCREMTELLIDYVAGELGEDYAALVREHLDLCKPCDHYLHSYKLTIEISRNLPPAPVPDRLLDRLRAAARQQEGHGAVPEAQ